MALYYIYRRSLMCHGIPCFFLMSISTLFIVVLYNHEPSSDKAGKLCSHLNDPDVIGTRPSTSGGINRGALDQDRFNSVTSMKTSRRFESNSPKKTMRRKPLTNRYDDDGVGDFDDNNISGTLPNQSTKSDEPMFVVVLAQMRTGSSVIGQILNQNKDMFYIYEPLHVVLDWQSDRGVDLSRFGGNDEIITEILRNISQCRFSEDFVRSYGLWGGRTKCSALMPMCEKAHVCEKLAPFVFEQTCSSFGGMVATKLIRAGLDHIRPLVEVDRLNVKVIHLVRDPRGTANSRLDYYVTKGVPVPAAKSSKRQQRLSTGIKVINSNGNGLSNAESLSNETIFPEVVNKIRPLCKWMTTNVRSALSRPAWLRGRYMVVRYEDFADEPLRVAKDMYRFLGRPAPRRVLSWIRNNTQDNHQDYDYVRNRLYTMHRNASATASKWRTGLTRKEAFHVQSVCSEAMKLLGYKLIAPDTDITDLSIPLLGPLRLRLP